MGQSSLNISVGGPLDSDTLNRGQTLNTPATLVAGGGNVSSIPDQTWFGMWGADPISDVTNFTSLYWDPQPDDATIQLMGGPSLRFLYPVYKIFCQNPAMS